MKTQTILSTIFGAVVATLVMLLVLLLPSTYVHPVGQNDVPGGVLYHMSDHSVRVCSDFAPDQAECTGTFEQDIMGR